MRVDQFRGLAVDQRHAADLSGPISVNNVILDGCEVDHFGKGVTDFVRTVVEAENSHLFLAEMLEFSPGERQYGIANLDGQLTGRLLDCADRHFLDAVDDREADRPAPAVEAAEQQHGCSLGLAAAGPSAIRAARSSASS